MLEVCNPDIGSLADEQELFSNAPPMLFGEGFETKIKDRAEALKILHKGQQSNSTHSHSGRQTVFLNQPPLQPPKRRRLSRSGKDPFQFRVPESLQPISKEPQKLKDRKMNTTPQVIYPIKVLDCTKSMLGFRELRVTESCQEFPVAGRIRHFLHIGES